MLSIDLTGKRALVAGVADDGGFGFAIAKALAEAGAKVSVATWPPALGIFKTMLERGKFDASLAARGRLARCVREDLSARCRVRQARGRPGGAAREQALPRPGRLHDRRARERLKADRRARVDIVVHSLANGPEVKKPMLETSRKGYLGALSASRVLERLDGAALGPMMRRGGSFLSLSYMAAERVVPGYGGGMSSAKAALESDTRMLAYEAGRKWGHRVNVISAGPYASRAASAIGFIEEMIDYAKRELAAAPTAITAEEVGATAAFLCSPLASGITGATVYVDKGYAAMGLTRPSEDRTVNAAFRSPDCMGAVRERNRLDRRRARTVWGPTVWRHGREPTAQGGDRHRGCGVVDEVSAAEVEVEERVVRRSARAGAIGTRSEVKPRVFEDVCGDPWIGDEGEHAQVIAAARALAPVRAVHQR